MLCEADASKKIFTFLTGDELTGHTILDNGITCLSDKTNRPSLLVASDDYQAEIASLFLQCMCELVQSVVICVVLRLPTQDSGLQNKEL